METQDISKKMVTETSSFIRVRTKIQLFGFRTTTKIKPMLDVMPPSQRHHFMLHIRSKATKSEIFVRKWLWAQ